MSKFIHPVSAAACLERWHAAHKDVVERVFRKRLRLFPDHIFDGIQSFWLDFLEQERCEQFNPELCPSEAGYVGVLALRRAMNLFLDLVKKNGRTAAIEDAEPASRSLSSGSASNDASEYLLHLVATNRMRPVDALVFLCKTWVHLGPVELAKRHGDATLFDLCNLVATHCEGLRDNLEVPQKIVQVLREQLAFPPRSPLGKRRLTEWGQDRRDHTRPDCTLEDELPGVLFDCLERAKQICEKGKPLHQSAGDFLKRVVASWLEALKNRFKFLLELAQNKLKQEEKLLVWGWEKLLNMGVENYGGLPCMRGAQWFVARMAFLLPGYPAPWDLTQSLTGPYPDKTIICYLQLLQTDSNKAVRAVEARYRRACSRLG